MGSRKDDLWLVTGGAGFIGSHIVRELARLGRRVRVLDNLSTGALEKIGPALPKVELQRGDIRDPDACRSAVKGAAFVLHQAAMRSVPRSVEHPEETHDVNVTGTLNLLVAAREAKIRRFVYASSSSVYGESRRFPQKETHIGAPISPYAASKLAGEHYCFVFSRAYGLETVSLRYFNVFGPGQDPESQYSAVIPRFIEQALRKESLEVHWDGRQSRDFTYVGNVVEANLLAAQARRGVGLALNIGNGNSHSLLDLIEVLEKLFGRRLERSFHPKRAGDVRKTFADISQARRLLGYRPSVGWADGLRETWKYFTRAST